LLKKIKYVFHFQISWLIVLLVTCSVFAQTDTLIQLNLLNKILKTDSSETHILQGTRFLKDSVIAYANTYLGRNYRRGGVSATGFDCSGFTMIIFAKHGIRLPHTSAGQSLVGIDIKKNQGEKGDLIFFKGRSRKSKRIGHVGLIISNRGEPIRFIHSSVTDGVRIDHLDAPYYKVRFVKIKRVILH